MQLSLAHIAARVPSRDPVEALVQGYLVRMGPFARCEATAFRDPAALLAWVGRLEARTRPVLVLLDSRGRQMSSEAFAAWLGERRDGGAQNVVFAIGPPDGWGDSLRGRADLLLSLGQFTLAHPLARLVMAEQLYRACTILAGHPYHSGH